MKIRIVPWQMGLVCVIFSILFLASGIYIFGANGSDISPDEEMYMEESHVYPETLEQLIDYFAEIMIRVAPLSDDDYIVMSGEKILIHDIPNKIRDILTESGRSRHEYIDDFNSIIYFLKNDIDFFETSELFQHSSFIECVGYVQGFIENAYNMNDVIFHIIIFSGFLEPLDLLCCVALWFPPVYGLDDTFMSDYISDNFSYKILPNTGLVLASIDTLNFLFNRIDI